MFRFRHYLCLNFHNPSIEVWFGLIAEELFILGGGCPWTVCVCCPEMEQRGRGAIRQEPERKSLGLRVQFLLEKLLFFFFNSWLDGNNECTQALTIDEFGVKSKIPVSKRNLKSYMVTRKC